MSRLLTLGESFCEEDPLEPIAEHLEQVARVRSRLRADRRRRGWTVIVGSEGVRWVHMHTCTAMAWQLTTGILSFFSFSSLSEENPPLYTQEMLCTLTRA